MFSSVVKVLDIFISQNRTPVLDWRALSVRVQTFSSNEDLRISFKT